MIRTVISGSGKMGRAIADALEREPDVDVVAVVDKLAATDAMRTAGGRDLRLYRDAAECFDAAKADAVIDFTNAAWTPELTAAAVPRGVRPVIGTSGLSPEYVEALRRECAERKLGGVVAANFAVGAVLLTEMARLAARHFDAAEIVELHHDQKVDAPSGTAIATARAMIEARGAPFARNEPDLQPVPGARSASLGGVTMHSVRLPGLVAHQEVIFGGVGQTLTIRHDTTGRDSFMPGILLALREVTRREELVVGLEHLLLSSQPDPNP